jgi:hypothetical protein
MVGVTVSVGVLVNVGVGVEVAVSVGEAVVSAVFVGGMGEAAPEELQAVNNMLRRMMGNLVKIVRGIWLFLGRFYGCLAC